MTDHGSDSLSQSRVGDFPTHRANEAPHHLATFPSAQGRRPQARACAPEHYPGWCLRPAAAGPRGGVGRQRRIRLLGPQDSRHQHRRPRPRTDAARGRSGLRPRHFVPLGKSQAFLRQQDDARQQFAEEKIGSVAERMTRGETLGRKIHFSDLLKTSVRQATNREDQSAPDGVRLASGLNVPRGLKGVRRPLRNQEQQGCCDLCTDGILIQSAGVEPDSVLRREASAMNWRADPATKAIERRRSPSSRSSTIRASVGVRQAPHPAE